MTANNVHSARFWKTDGRLSARYNM